MFNNVYWYEKLILLYKGHCPVGSIVLEKRWSIFTLSISLSVANRLSSSPSLPPFYFSYRTAVTFFIIQRATSNSLKLNYRYLPYTTEKSTKFTSRRKKRALLSVSVPQSRGNHHLLARFSPVLWIRNYYFRIRIRLWV